MATIDELVVKIKQEGAEDLEQSLEDMESEDLFGGDGGGNGDSGSGGGLLSGLMSAVGGLSAAMMAVLAVLGSIVGVLLTLEPIQKILEGFFKVIQAFFMPLAVMLMKLLQPVLAFLIKLLPLWYKFIRNLQNLSLSDWLNIGTEAFLASIFPPLGFRTVLNHVFPEIDLSMKDFVGLLFPQVGAMFLIQEVFSGGIDWSFIRDPFLNVINGIIGIVNNVPFVDIPKVNQGQGQGSSGSNDYRDTLPGRDRGRFSDLDQGNETNIVIEGGLGSLIERIEKDPDTYPF